MKLISDRIKTVWLPLSKRDIYETIPNDMVDPPKSQGRIRITIEMLESMTNKNRFQLRLAIQFYFITAWQV